METITGPTMYAFRQAQRKDLIRHIHDTYAQAQHKHGDMPRPRARCQFAGCYLHAVEIDRSSAQGRTQEAVHHCTTNRPARLMVVHEKNPRSISCTRALLPFSWIGIMHGGVLFLCCG